MKQFIISFLTFLIIINASAINKTTIKNSSDSIIVLSNGITGIKFNFNKGNYSILNEIRKETVLENVHVEADMISFHDRDHLNRVTLNWHSNDTVDILGSGKYLEVWAKRNGVPDVMIRFTIYDNEPFIVLQNGIYNDQPNAVRLKNLVPLSDGELTISGISEVKNLLFSSLQHPRNFS